MVQQSSPVDEERAHARAAGLTYVSDTEPGIRRKAAGTGFSYRGLDGEPISDPDALTRIRARRNAGLGSAARSTTATARRPGAMIAGASNTATTRTVAMCARPE
jgi:hypothetical protein